MIYITKSHLCDIKSYLGDIKSHFGHIKSHLGHIKKMILVILNTITKNGLFYQKQSKKKYVYCICSNLFVKNHIFGCTVDLSPLNINYIVPKFDLEIYIWPWLWHWIIITLSEMDYPCINTTNRGITLASSFICWKVMYINCGPQKCSSTNFFFLGGGVIMFFCWWFWTDWLKH